MVNYNGSMVDFKCMVISELSVFFPSYNEEKNVKKTVLDAKKVLEKFAEKWEIIIVDDGSKDKTGEIADSLSKKYKNIQVVHHKPNRGYGGALKSGFNAAKYSWVAFTDADGQFDFAEITKFIQKQNETGADLILGIRKQRSDSTMRKLFTFVWSRLIPKILFGMKVTDYSCGFKLIKKRVYEEVLPLVGEEKVTQIEMLVKAQRKGFQFAEVGVSHYPRVFGHNTGADLKVVTKSISDLFKLWLQLR
jgi:glycosyltransferase involved in cell wall biosynthesis